MCVFVCLPLGGLVDLRPHPAQQVFGLWLNLRRVSPHQPPPRDAWQCRRRSDGAPIGGIGMRLEEFKDIRSDLNTTSSRRMITKKKNNCGMLQAWVGGYGFDFGPTGQDHRHNCHPARAPMPAGFPAVYQTQAAILEIRV